jgi:hypothetical protein
MALIISPFVMFQTTSGALTTLRSGLEQRGNIRSERLVGLAVRVLDDARKHPPPALNEAREPNTVVGSVASFGMTEDNRRTSSSTTAIRTLIVALVELNTIESTARAKAPSSVIRIRRSTSGRYPSL